jgi:hypothetical protein
VGPVHASVRFVSGGLDRVENREAFLDLARRPDVPILVIYGDQTPPESRAEMEALAKLHTSRSTNGEGQARSAQGISDAVANAIIPFLSE